MDSARVDSGERERFSGSDAIHSSIALEPQPMRFLPRSRRSGNVPCADPAIDG